MASMFLETFVSICSTVGRGWIADAVGHFDNARIAQLNILVMEYGLSAAIVIMISTRTIFTMSTPPNDVVSSAATLSTRNKLLNSPVRTTNPTAT